MKAHPDFSRFFRFLSDPALYTPWSGRVLRQTLPRWLSTPYRITGAGALLKGARWNVKGLMPAVYGSTDPDTLHEEGVYKARRFGWTDDDFKPKLTLSMQWRLQEVLDLTSPEILDVLGIQQTDIVGCDWEQEQLNGREAITQAIGRAAFEKLAEGLVVPSARRPGGVNVVYYPAHRREGTIIETLDRETLPQDMHGLDA